MNYQINYIQYQIFMIIFIKQHKHSPIKKYINKTENTITFEIKTEYFLELLISETMRLLGSTENKTTKD